jgi:hypothetical protein
MALAQHMNVRMALLDGRTQPRRSSRRKLVRAREHHTRPLLQKPAALPCSLRNLDRGQILLRLPLSVAVHVEVHDEIVFCFATDLSEQGRHTEAGQEELIGCGEMSPGDIAIAPAFSRPLPP